MQSRVAYSGAFRIHRAIAAVLLAGSAAACSGDNSRFAASPFSNPFEAASSAKVDRSTTQSIPSRAAPSDTMVRQPLPPALSSSASPPVTRVASATLQNAQPIVGSAAGWTPNGGTPVTVGSGDTANSLSARYGVPVSAITAANGGGIRPGQTAIIPVYNGSSAAVANKSGLMNPVAAAPVEAPQAIAPAPRAPVAATAAQLPPPRPVAPIPTVAAAKAQATAKVAEAPKQAAGRILPAGPQRSVVVTPPKPQETAQQMRIAAAKPLKAANPLKPAPADDDDDEEDEKPAIKPAPRKAEAAPTPAPVKKEVRVIPMTQQKPEQLAAAKPQAPASDNVTTQSIPAAPAAPQQQAKADERPEFRWPAKGRVISGFGAKGGNGDGISIAVPEGTAVKAAEGGVVAYAGEELKGYGKLVLVRHDNGFVSAYAHNGELNVKRGEKVSRGQTIAKSGATGNVTSPQLHFELRKGSTPVDPTKYLEN